MVTTHAFRLLPGQDLKKEIECFASTHHLEAGWVASCVGSLTEYHIRFANEKDGSRGSGHFEILGVTGTLSINGSHLHICISDQKGKAMGGHLLEGNKVYTTAEIILQQTDDFVFTRETDPFTQWKVLQIKKKDA